MPQSGRTVDMYQRAPIGYSIDICGKVVDAVKRMDGRHGLFMCEGNHDLFHPIRMGGHDRASADVTVQVSGLGVDLPREQGRSGTVRVGDPHDPAPGTFERIDQRANLRIGDTGLVGEQACVALYYAPTKTAAAYAPVATPPKPGENPVATRLGIPTMRSIRAIAPENCWQ